MRAKLETIYRTILTILLGTELNHGRMQESHISAHIRCTTVYIKVLRPKFEFIPSWCHTQTLDKWLRLRYWYIADACDQL